MIKNTPLIFVIKIWCAILIMGPNNDVDDDLICGMVNDAVDRIIAMNYLEY
jgi:hypothetical protein